MTADRNRRKAGNRHPYKIKTGRIMNRKKNKVKTLSQRDRYRIVTIIGMSISGLALLVIFSSVLALYTLDIYGNKLTAENPGSLIYRYPEYLLYGQISIAAVTAFASFFFMFHKVWARSLLIKAIWGFFLFYVFVGIIPVFDSNRNINTGDMSSVISFVLSLCIVAFMMRYIYIYVSRLVEKINSEKISKLFK